MSSSTETLSQQLIENMNVLAETVRQSFKKTDLLINQLGYSRESLTESLNHQRAMLSPTQRKKLDNYEKKRLRELDRLTLNEPVNTTSRQLSVQVGLLDHI